MVEYIEKGNFMGIELRSKGAEIACKMVTALIILDVLFMGIVGLKMLLA